MRVGVYNRWLPTLGGGERYTLDFARALDAAGHDVDVITHQPIERAAIEGQLRLDLGRVALRRVPDSPGNGRVSAVSAEYDLFLNVSHGDLVRSQARHSALVVHFPAPLESYASGVVPVSNATEQAASRVCRLEGVYPPESDGARSWVWTGAHARTEVERTTRSAARALVLRLASIWPAEVAPPRVSVLIDGMVLGERADHWTTWRLPLPHPLQGGERCVVELLVEPWTLRGAGIAPDDRDRGLPLMSAELVGGLLEARFGARAAPWTALAPDERSRAEVVRALDSYDQIVANSRFTQQWITRRWSRPSRVLYPAIDLPPGTPDALLAAKAPVVLSVGRFFAGAHNKKHLPMIDAFRALCDAGLRGWEYHLVGGCDLQQPAQRAYLAEVEARAAGYPIVLHVNAPGEELQGLYKRASLFWHATGYGEDVEQHPDSFEHFGITTAEALAAGCVPIVIAKAGQVEIVEDGASGFLWDDLAELAASTRLLIDDAALREGLARGAIKRSHTFSYGSFARQVIELLTEVSS